MKEIVPCYHCGKEVSPKYTILFDDKDFCCKGCQTVYEIFQQNDLGCYYDYASTPGITPPEIQGKYDFLEHEEIISKLLEFQESQLHVVSWHIPAIHCSSCIWILENLQKLNSGVITSQVNFPQKKIRITYHPEQTNLKQLAYLLSSIGYEPYISLENLDKPKTHIPKELLYKIGVAFFSFGNIMLLSFPEYFEVNEFWINQYKGFFRWLIFGLSLPPFIYSASGYYISAFKSIKSGFLNIDVPIALGIVVMFVRSTLEIIMDWGQGFFDSMTGLIFFMLLGKLFQQKTYEFLSFERDYKSYFPVAVTKILADLTKQAIPIYEIQKGDRLFLRNQELLPVDAILISEEANIDYSFVTGEAEPILKKSGDKCFAGGKIIGKPVEVEVLLSVEQSYLTQLWSNEVFQKKQEETYQTITNKVSKYFTPALLFIAFAGLFYWLTIDTLTAFNVFTAVLIVACPCALALTAPFTLGNALRILGRKKMYLKNAQVIENLAKINRVVLDKTGTITTAKKRNIEIYGNFTEEEKEELAVVFSASNHPLSRQIAEEITTSSQVGLEKFIEETGKGVEATIHQNTYRIGSANWVGSISKQNSLQTEVHVSKNGIYLGKFVFHNQYRENLKEVLDQLHQNYGLAILSGDNEGEKVALTSFLPPNTPMYFNQKPEQKLEKIKEWQQTENVLMIGDGLNDAGALAQSNVGIAISEDVNVFSPACDAIVDASKFEELPALLRYAKKAMKTIYTSFTVSLLYNVVGLSFALAGTLSPLVAAIIMPLSTITIVSLVTLMTNYYAWKIFKQNESK
jgi:Cu+-exporting ATPase